MVPSFTAFNTRDAFRNPPPDVLRAPAIPPDIAEAIHADAEAEPSNAKAPAPGTRLRGDTEAPAI